MKNIFFIILFFSSLCSSELNRFNILNFLKNKNYDKLCEIFDNLQKEYEQDPKKEDNYLEALRGFGIIDDNIEKSLKDWVKKRENCNYSHLALGLYYMKKGWYERGYKLSKDTTQEQFENMFKYFEKSTKELNWVIKHNKKIPFAYALQFYMYKSYEYSNRLYREGIKNNPYSFYIRSSYIKALLPIYGMRRKKGSLKINEALKMLPFADVVIDILSDEEGSRVDYYKEIKKVVNESKRYYSKNSKLKKLQGSVEYAKAETLYMQKRVKEALKYLNLALKKSPDYKRYLDLKARILWHLNKYKEAYLVYKKLIKKSPYEIDYLKSYMSLSKKLKKYDEAREIALKILKLDDKIVGAWITLGEYYYNHKEFNKAYEAFFNASLYKSDSAYINYYLGAISYWYKKDYKRATEYLEKSHSKGENSAGLNYMLAVSYWYQKDCRFVKYAYAYSNICKKEGNCESQKLDWALKSADFAIKRGVCKK